MNLIKGKWDGKVGQLVGAKWKDKSTIRSYTPPSNPDTPAQQTVRTTFGEVTAYVALFAPDLKGLSALPIRGQSIRNAIIQLNKEFFQGGGWSPTALLVSRGGLPQPTGATVSIAASTGVVTANWRTVTGQNVSAKAKGVVVVVNATKKTAVVLSGLNTESQYTGTLPTDAGDTVHCYAYLLDFRGSSRVGSQNVYITATIA